MKYIVSVAVLVMVGILTIYFLAKDTIPEEYNTSTLDKVLVYSEVPEDADKATFAGGCFWCTEAVFQEQEGVYEVISGYVGGTEYNPTYEDVYKGRTSHKEGVRVYYDEDRISYSQLLDVYWLSIDPTDSGGQFIDRGESYTTAIYYETEAQRIAAEVSKAELAASGRFSLQIVTEIKQFTTFYEAEEYHQDFYIKSTERYKSYADSSGREEFKDFIWGEISN